MIQSQHMASWVPVFKAALENQLNIGNEQYIPFQLSTIGTDGFPKARTVVFRGFLFSDKTNNILTFTTDTRMEKYKELEADDRIEAVFNLMSVKKQFRFKGRARIIDSKYKPIIDLSTIQPRNYIRNVSSGYDSEEEEEEEEGEEEEEKGEENDNNNNDDDDDNDNDNDNTRDDNDEADKLSFSVKTKLNLNTSVQNKPINHHLVSPALVHRLYSATQEKNMSFSNLGSLPEVNFLPPTDTEWDEEISRQWESLSKHLKKTFRKPPPKSIMNHDNAKLIDSIHRGVDGKKEIDGLKNFAVIGLFIESCDYFDNEKDKRVIFEKDSYHLWKEYEVCP